MVMSYESTMGTEVRAATTMPYESRAIGPQGAVGPYTPYVPHFMHPIGGGALRSAPSVVLGTIGEAIQSPMTLVIGLAIMGAGAFYLYKGVKG
jgi:hypothetical protein